MSNPVYSGVTRLEIIDHSPCDGCGGIGRIKVAGQGVTHECPACHGGGMTGREVIFFDPNKQIMLSLQDDDRTLKIFVNKRGE